MVVPLLQYRRGVWSCKVATPAVLTAFVVFDSYVATGVVAILLPNPLLWA